ncbi:MAG: hypothetical protein JWN06_2809, partial [Propionibacteriaceae bacterium]|nr:hypothetical protein [Propionibacteriaceae bacterium]
MAVGLPLAGITPSSRVPSTAGREGQREPWPVTVGAGEALVDVDAVVTDAQGGEPVMLSGESWCSVDTRAYRTSSCSSLRHGDTLTARQPDPGPTVVVRLLAG